MARPDKRAVAQRLIDLHFEIEPSLERVLYFHVDDDELITLIEVTESTPASGKIETFVFSPTDDIPFPTRVAEITPDEYVRFRNDPDSAPPGWDFSKAEEFIRRAS